MIVLSEQDKPIEADNEPNLESRRIRDRAGDLQSWSD